MSFLHFPKYAATIRWTDFGQGEPILFLPGLSMPVLGGFAAVAADPLLSGRRNILLDYLGSGTSDHPDGFDYALSSHVATIIRVLDHLDLAAVDVVGHSMGGTVAIQLALEHPGRVRRVIIGEGNVDPGGGVMSLRIAQAGQAAFLSDGYNALLDDLRSKAHKGAAGADRLVAGWQHADPVGLFANAKALVDLPDAFFAQFAALSVPRSFVYGARNVGMGETPDTPNPDRLRAHGITPYVVEHAGHAMMLDNHAGFMRVLSDALSQQ